MTKRGREEGRGGGRGLRSRQTPTSLKQASAAAATYAVPKWLAAFSRKGMSHLLCPLRTTLVPDAGTKTNPRSTGPQGALCGLTLGSHTITRRDTLMIMRTDLTAAPHAGLRNKILKNQVKGGCTPLVIGHEMTSRRDDDVPCVTADALALYKKKRKKGGRQLRLTMRPGAPSRYVFTTAWMGLRWPMPSKCPWAPCSTKRKHEQYNLSGFV